MMTGFLTNSKNFANVSESRKLRAINELLNYWFD